jgi:hypothetical protein
VQFGHLPSDRRVWTEEEIAADVDVFQQQMPAQYDEYLRQEIAANEIEADLGEEMGRLAGRLFPDARESFTEIAGEQGAFFIAGIGGKPELENGFFYGDDSISFVST